MNPYIKMLLVLILFGAGAASGWWVTANHYKAVIAENESAQSAAVTAAYQAQLEAIAAHDKLKHDAEVRHGKDQDVVNNLRSQLSDGVRIHIPSSCGAAAQGSATSAGTDGEARILSGGVDAAFASLQSGADRLFARCDQLNIDATRLNGEIAQ